MSSPEFSVNQDRRKQILEAALLVVRNIAQKEENEATELLKSSADLDGPWQSKQPDEMIKLENMVNLHDHQHAAFKAKALEIQDILNSGGSSSRKIEAGSVFTWDLNDPESDIKGETVIVTPSGGGEFESLRLLSLSAPLTKAILGKTEGDKIRFGEIMVTIKEII